MFTSNCGGKIAKHPSVRGGWRPPSVWEELRRKRLSQPPLAQRASAGASPKRNSQGWRSSSDDDDHDSSQRIPRPWISCSSQPPPSPDGVPTTPPARLPPGFQSPPVSDADGSLTGLRQVDCPLRLRVDEAFASYREDDRDGNDAWGTEQSCSASRHVTLISHLFADREPAPEFMEQSPRRFPGPALRSDQRSWRQTDKLQIFSWNHGLARVSDPSTPASHLNGPWHVICIQEGPGFVTDSSLFHVITQHHCAVLLNKDTFTRGFSSTPIQVPCSLRYSSWAVEGMVVTDKFRRGARPVVLPIHRRQHPYQQRVRKKAVRVRCVSAPRPRPVLEAWRCHPHWRPSTKALSAKQRTGLWINGRMSPLEAVFCHANIAWPTSGLTPLWGPAVSSKVAVA